MKKMVKLKLPANNKNYLTWCGRQFYRGSHSICDVVQCKSNTVKKKRCRKKTAHTPKCWIHLANEDNLRIKPSNIQNAGKGLFSWKKQLNANNTLLNIQVKKQRWKNSIVVTVRKQLHNIAYVMVQRDVPRFANGARGTRGENSCFRVKIRKLFWKQQRL